MSPINNCSCGSQKVKMEISCGSGFAKCPDCGDYLTTLTKAEVTAWEYAKSHTRDEIIKNNDPEMALLLLGFKESNEEMEYQSNLVQSLY